MPVIVVKQLIEGELQLLAFDAHLQGAAQLENDDAGLQLFLVDQQGNLPYGRKILKSKSGKSQARSRLKLRQAPGAPLAAGAVSPSYGN